MSLLVMEIKNKQFILILKIIGFSILIFWLGWKAAQFTIVYGSVSVTKTKIPCDSYMEFCIREESGKQLMQYHANNLANTQDDRLTAYCKLKKAYVVKHDLCIK